MDVTSYLDFLDYYGSNQSFSLVDGSFGCYLVKPETTSFHFSFSLTNGTETLLSSFFKLTVYVWF